MARRSNFIEGNDNFREQNLRFVRNEFEDNINQFFGGANPGGSGQQKPPPRDSLIVQPTAGKKSLRFKRIGANRIESTRLNSERLGSVLDGGQQQQQQKQKQSTKYDGQPARYELNGQLNSSQAL
ncbi:hypothetical protein M5D96_004999 [Drosophila gunungcola]|uniref:Uncharacterized protein n=1 Tax=Drosophila gunungcola TaxID=103775 RepID=A0A9P9YV64_9MUSC|nr:hypothetical protein M5D96_004999 [Drosophila gunungcola]